MPWYPQTAKMRLNVVGGSVPDTLITALGSGRGCLPDMRMIIAISARLRLAEVPFINLANSGAAWGPGLNGNASGLIWQHLHKDRNSAEAAQKTPHLGDKGIP